MFQEEIISAGGKGKASSAEGSKTKEDVIFPIEVLNDGSSRTEETHFNARMIKSVKWMVDSEAANYMTNERFLGKSRTISGSYLCIRWYEIIKSEHKMWFPNHYR